MVSVDIYTARFKLLTLRFQKNPCRPHPLRGLKLLSEAGFYYLNTKNVSKHGINIGLCQNFQLIGLGLT